MPRPKGSKNKKDFNQTPNVNSVEISDRPGEYIQQSNPDVLDNNEESSEVVMYNNKIINLDAEKIESPLIKKTQINNIKKSDNPLNKDSSVRNESVTIPGNELYNMFD